MFDDKKKNHNIFYNDTYNHEIVETTICKTTFFRCSDFVFNGHTYFHSKYYNYFSILHSIEGNVCCGKYTNLLLFLCT